MSKQHFFLKLNPPRPSFMMDMSDEEKQIMHSHVGYWNQLLEEGIAIVFGPVMHPNGGHGVGVVAVDSEEQLKEVIAKDPANGLNVYEFFPMRAVYKEN